MVSSEPEKPYGLRHLEGQLSEVAPPLADMQCSSACSTGYRIHHNNVRAPLPKAEYPGACLELAEATVAMLIFFSTATKTHLIATLFCRFVHRHI